MTKFIEGQCFSNSLGSEVKVHSFTGGHILYSFRSSPSHLWELCRLPQKHFEVLLSAEKMEERDERLHR